MRSRLAAAAGAFLLVMAGASPAGAAHRVIDDRESGEVAGVAIAKTRFTYGARVRVDVSFSYLAAGAVDQYMLQARGPDGHTWSVGWDPVGRTRWFTHFMWPGESADDVRCAVRWRENQPRQRLTMSFPSSCVRLDGRPPSRLRMTFSATDFWDDGSYLTDSAPGGNSVVGNSSRFTRPIRYR